MKCSICKKETPYDVCAICNQVNLALPYLNEEALRYFENLFFLQRVAPKLNKSKKSKDN
jgi:hypothetical protein